VETSHRLFFPPRIRQYNTKVFAVLQRYLSSSTSNGKKNTETEVNAEGYLDYIINVSIYSQFEILQKLSENLKHYIFSTFCKHLLENKNFCDSS